MLLKILIAYLGLRALLMIGSSIIDIVKGQPPIVWPYDPYTSYTPKWKRVAVGLVGLLLVWILPLWKRRQHRGPPATSCWDRLPIS